MGSNLIQEAKSRIAEIANVKPDDIRVDKNNNFYIDGTKAYATLVDKTLFFAASTKPITLESKSSETSSRQFKPVNGRQEYHPAMLNEFVSSELAKAKENACGKSFYLCVFDAGHGAKYYNKDKNAILHDPGAISKDGFSELDYTRKVEAQLRSISKDTNIYFVHTSDLIDKVIFASNAESVRVRRDIQERLAAVTGVAVPLISLHADGSLSSLPSGATVLRYDDNKAAVNLADVIKENYLESDKLIAGSNNPHGKCDLPDFKKCYQRESKAYILAGQGGSALIEAGYLSNKADAERLEKEESHSAMAGLVFSSVNDYYGLKVVPKKPQSPATQPERNNNDDQLEKLELFLLTKGLKLKAGEELLIDNKTGHCYIISNGVRSDNAIASKIDDSVFYYKLSDDKKGVIDIAKIAPDNALHRNGDTSIYVDSKVIKPSRLVHTNNHPMALA